MKKILSLATAAVLALSLVACGSSDTATTTAAAGGDAGHSVLGRPSDAGGAGQGGGGTFL